MGFLVSCFLDFLGSLVSGTTVDVVGVVALVSVPGVVVGLEVPVLASVIGVVVGGKVALLASETAA